MTELAVTLRAAQFTAHHAHNLTRGPAFFADHAHLGELYAAYEEAYDQVVERMIGLGSLPDLCAITSEAASRCGDSPNAGPEAAFTALLASEAAIRTWCAVATPSATLGTQNLLAQLADDSEARTYKLQRRLGA